MEKAVKLWAEVIRGPKAQIGDHCMLVLPV